MAQLPLLENDLLNRIISLLRAQPTPCYVAGGYVRDWLLGRAGKDVDFTVAEGAIPLARRVANATGGAFYVLDEEMDAARIVYPQHDLVVDFARLRGADIEADLRARDFSINAMAVDVRDCDRPAPPILDPCGGQRDLAAHVLRATSEGAFRHDPVRLLRAVRFAALFALQIDPVTEVWLRRDAPLLTRPSAERIRQELALIVAAPDAAAHLRRLDDLGLLAVILPEMVALKGVSQPPDHHVYDAYEHTLVTVAEVERLTTFPTDFAPLTKGGRGDQAQAEPRTPLPATSAPLTKGGRGDQAQVEPRTPLPATCAPLAKGGRGDQAQVEPRTPLPATPAPLTKGGRGDQVQVEPSAALPGTRFTPAEAPFLGPFAADLAAHFAPVLCEKRTRATLLRFAAMLHDLAKPQHRMVKDNGQICFHGHEGDSAAMAQAILTRLRFSAQEVQLVSAIVAGHMRPGFLVKDAPVSRRAMYRFFRDTGDAAVDVLILSLADHLAARGPTLLADHWRQHLEFTRTMLEHYFRTPQQVASPPQLVTGRDVMKLLGLRPGPRVGQMLEAVREAQAEGQVRTREEALEFLRRHDTDSEHGYTD